MKIYQDIGLEDNLMDMDRMNSIISIPSIASDFVTSICGEFIASGTYRSVFHYNLDEKYVVKVEPKSTNCNLIEALIWQEVQWLTGRLNWVRDWFAPVKWISPNGRILVMRKTREQPDKKRPDKIPAFLWDAAYRNFGWIGDKLVCHDYSNFYTMVNYQKRMVKINW